MVGYCFVKTKKKKKQGRFYFAVETFISEGQVFYELHHY